MGPSPTYHPPKGGECETWVEHGLPLWAEPAVGCRSRQLRPSPVRGSRFVGARAVGPWVGERKPLGKTPCGATPVPSPPTYLPDAEIWGTFFSGKPVFHPPVRGPYGEAKIPLKPDPLVYRHREFSLRGERKEAMEKLL